MAGDDQRGGAADAAFDQFQRAALDAVKAARAMLDAAETMIKDPAAIEAVVHAATSFARTAGETVVGFAAGAAGARPPGTHAPTEHDDGDDGDDGGFERIRVD